MMGSVTGTAGPLAKSAVTGNCGFVAVYCMLLAQRARVMDAWRNRCSGMFYVRKLVHGGARGVVGTHCGNTLLCLDIAAV